MYKEEQTKREIPVCKHCGSDKMIFDASAQWNPENQSFEICDTYSNKAFCNNCETEDWADWQEYSK